MRDSLKDRYILYENTAWELKARDKFIGRDEVSRLKYLNLIANNTILLVLTWIHVNTLLQKQQKSIALF
jgi:hypothetical protein